MVYQLVYLEKEKSVNKTLSMFTVSERNLRHTFKKISKHFISLTVDVLNKTKELSSELHRRVSYCLFKKKMKRIKSNPNYYASIGNIT